MAKRGEGRKWQRNGVWYIGYQAPEAGRSKEIRESCGRGATEAEAEALLALRLRHIANEREGIRRFVGPASERVLLKELLEDLIADHETRKLASMQPTRSHVKALSKVLGGHRAKSITTAVVDRYVRGRRKAGVAEATIDRELEMLRRAFRLGARATPPKVLAVPYVPRLLGKHENARQGFFDADTFAALLEHIPSEPFRDYLEWFFYTGWRVRESGTLEWQHFDRSTWTLRLAARNAKIKRVRVVPLVGPLRAIIERRLEARIPSCRLVFHEDGMPIISIARKGLRKRYYGQWYAACVAAGLPDEGEPGHLIPYDLRRTATRNLRRLGFADSIVMAITGHLTRDTFDRYGIVDERDLSEVFQALAPLPTPGSNVVALPSKHPAKRS